MMNFSSDTASQLAAALRKGYCRLILKDKRIQRIRTDIYLLATQIEYCSEKVLFYLLLNFRERIDNSLYIQFDG